jgi:hypothetical protein
VSPEGKAKSAKNAHKHGLTGKIEEPSEDERAKLDALRAKLEAHFKPIGPAQDLLIERALVSTLQLNRTRTLITSIVEDLAGLKVIASPREPSPMQQYMREAERTLCELYGDKKVSVRLLRMLAEEAGFRREASQLPSTKLDQLARYAQRFRGERDGALKKLNRIRAQMINA